jgi:hypothetical protein
MLPGGFAMYGIGKGAICVSCHNSRNGVQNGSSTATFLHEDGEVYNAGNPTGYSAPHFASQGDVFAGRNAYFLGGFLPMTSKHAAVSDGCVGCHMTNNPETHLANGSSAVSTHVFRITDDNENKLCATCHSSSVTGGGIQASVEHGLSVLSQKLGASVGNKIGPTAVINVVAYDSVSGLSSAPLKIDASANPLISATPDEIHGQISFDLTFTNPVTVQLVDSTGAPSGAPKPMVTFGVQLGSLKDNQPTPKPLYALTGNLVRASWNYFLIESDSSRGIHNPSFVTMVLDRSAAQDLSN